jgi:hypothetical protein
MYFSQLAGDIWYANYEKVAGNKIAARWNTLSRDGSRRELKDVAAGDIMPSDDARFYIFGAAGAQQDEVKKGFTDGRAALTVAQIAKGTRILPAAISPDGKYMMYFGNDDEPEVMDLADGKTWSLLDAPAVVDWSDFYQADWSPDGKFLVVAGLGTWDDSSPRVWRGITYSAVKARLKLR